MKVKQITETTAGATSAGSVASVAQPLGKVQKRTGNLFKGKKTSKPFYEQQVKEDEIVEQDLIIVPGQRRLKDTSFIPHEKDRRDHEVEMARSDLYAAAKDAMRIYKMLKNRTEDEGLMGWQQSYITLANDYLNSVADSLEHDAKVAEMTGGVLAGGMSNAEESVAEGSEILKVGTAVRVPHKGKMVPGKIIRYDSGKGGESPAYVVDIGEYESKIVPVHNMKQGVAEGRYGRYYDPMGDERREQDAMDQERRDFKRREMEYELRNEPKNNYQVNIDGKSWKVFASKEQAEKAARTIERKYNKKATVHLTGAAPTNEAKAHKCPECGGEIVSEELMNEKKDACYYKVKSRYKVWPSAYASGALVKCRKSGASNWGNKSKK